MSYLAAHALARAIAGGSLSSREVTRELLDRITSVGAPLNAVIELDAERALAAAASVDAQVALGGPLGPLAGVPVTIKEAFAVAGLPTTVGARSSSAAPGSGRSRVQYVAYSASCDARSPESASLSRPAGSGRSSIWSARRAAHRVSTRCRATDVSFMFTLAMPGTGNRRLCRR